MRILQLTENIQREALDPVEEARALKELMDLQHFSSRNVAERLHRSHTYVADRLKLIEHEDVARRLQESPALAPSVAAQIAREADAQVRQDLLDRAARGELRREDVRRLRQAKMPAQDHPLEQRERTLRDVGREMGASEAQLHVAAQARKEDPALTPAEAVALAVFTPPPAPSHLAPAATDHGAAVPEAPAAPTFGASATVALTWDEERAVVEIPTPWLYALGWDRDATLRLTLHKGQIRIDHL